MISLGERVFNLAAGLSVLSWAILGLLKDPTVVRWALSALQVVVGTLLIVRAPLRESGSVRAVSIALPSLVASGWSWRLTEGGSWSALSVAAFGWGAGFALVSVLYLGRSFAVLPARRAVVARGPYRLVRHPMYAGEMLMVTACFLAVPSAISIIPFLACWPLIMLRIREEEALLKADSDYVAYRTAVPHRLIPGIW